MSKSQQIIQTMLYVEDEEVIREELYEFLQHFCKELHVAENGAVGFELYKKYNPKIVVTDIKMPKMNGLEMAQKIRELDSDAHIIFTTAFSDTSYMLDAISLQATGYMLKPVDLSLFEALLNKTIKLANLQKELQRKNKTIREYLKIVDENVITSSTDINGVINYASEAFCRVSGFTKDELLGKTHAILRHEDMPSEVYQEIWQTLLKDKTWKGEILNKNKNGSSYWVRAKIYPVFDEDDVKVGYTAIRENITNLKIIEEISIRDALTGIYNRRHFNEYFPNFIKSAKRSNELIGFAILDIDYFKQYNDTYGHQKGDEVLQSVAECMQKLLTRADDALFRLGGEEFGILFKSASVEKGVFFMEKIVQSIAKMQIPHRKSNISEYVSISAGLVMEHAQNIQDDDTLYREADESLYRAKESGRNRVFLKKQEEIQ